MSDIEPRVYEGEVHPSAEEGFELRSYEDHINAWINEEDDVRKHRWRQCAIASSAVGKFEKNLVKNFARDVGKSIQSIYDDARAYRLRARLPKDYGQPETLSPTHYVEASYDDDPQRMLEEAEDDGLSSEAMRMRVKERKQEKAEEEHGPAGSPLTEVVRMKDCPTCYGRGKVVDE